MTGEKAGKGSSRGDRQAKKSSRRKAADTFGFRSRIPWTEEETKHIKELLEYLTMQLGEQHGSNQLPQEETKLLMTTLQQFLMQEELDRNDPLLSKIAYYFHDIQCVDLNKVAHLLKKNKEVGDSLQDQKVILLLGNASSGKTTTLHCLAGTTFKEAVVDGFVHLKPTQFLDASVAGYDTSCGRETVTKNLQIAKVKVQEEDYIVCDTPVFGDYDTIEEEIALKHGLVDALSRARCIRPVFVLSQECLGNRMSGLPQVFDMITKHFHIRDYNMEVIPFQYVFTRFDDRHRTRLWKMFKFYNDSKGSYGGAEPALFEKVVQDIAEKTNPEANVVSPVSDIPRYLLKRLLEDPALECEPKDSLKLPGPDESLGALHVQLKLTLYGLLMFLASQNYEAAVERVRNLTDLAAVLPAAEAYANLAIKACERYAIVLWESFNDRVENQDYMSALAHVNQSMQLAAALPEMDDYIVLSNGGFWQALLEMETKKCSNLIPADTVLGLVKMAKVSPEIHAELVGGIRKIRGFIQKELSKTEDLSEIVPRFMLLLRMGIGFQEANKGASELLDRLDARIMDPVKEQDYKKATEDLIAIAPMAYEFPDRTRFAVHAVKMYKHTLEQSIDKNVYENAGDILYYLTKMKDDYPAADKYATRGLEKLWKKFEYAIKQREYATAICIVKHMGKVSQLSETAFERSRLGIEVIRDRLFKSIESKDYGMAQVLMQQLNRLEKMLPKDMAARVKAKKLVEQCHPPKKSPSHGYRSVSSGTPERRDSPERQPPGHRSRLDDYYAEDIRKRNSNRKQAHRHHRSSDRRNHDKFYEDERDDREHRQHRHHRRERREEPVRRDRHNEGRDDVEEDMSELTMSAASYVKYSAYDPDKFSYARDEPPPPVHKISVRTAEKERRDSPPRYSSAYEKPPLKSRGHENHHKGREDPPPRKSRQKTHKSCHESAHKDRHGSPLAPKERFFKTRYGEQSPSSQKKGRNNIKSSSYGERPFDEYTRYNESLPAVTDDNTQRSFDTRIEETSMYRNERLRHVDAVVSSNDTGVSSWII